MTPSPRSISDTELEVLKVLWEEGEGTVRELQEKLRARERQWAYTTVQTLLHRLQVKGYASCHKRGRAHVFEAALTQGELLDEELDGLAARVCEGSSIPLMLNLVQRGRFTPEEIREFREHLDRLEQAHHADPPSDPPSDSKKTRT